MEKPALTELPLIGPIRNRWSPRAFAERPLSGDELQTLLEALRWAPSCFNAQPWAFLVAQRDEPEFALMVDCLVPGNQAWAEQAPVLLLALAEPNFSHNGKPNRHAWHDVGLALGNLLAQATAMGIAAHLMAGFSPEAARGAFQIPDTHSPVTLLALGYPGDPESLPDELRERELAPRSRKPLENFVFQQRFGTPRSF
jgi:nitroreductase